MSAPWGRDYPAAHLRQALTRLSARTGETGEGFFDSHPSTSRRLSDIEEIARPDIAAFWALVGSEEREALIASSPAFKPLEGIKTPEEATERLRTHFSTEVIRFLGARRIPYYRPNGKLLLSVEYPEMGTGSPMTRLIIRNAQDTIVGEMRNVGDTFAVLTPDGRRVGMMTVIENSGNDVYDLNGNLVAKIRMSGIAAGYVRRALRSAFTEPGARRARDAAGPPPDHHGDLDAKSDATLP